MKRALAIAVALCTIGFAGFSQIAIKGGWTAKVCLLPSTTLTSDLTLTYTVAGFDVTSVTGFGTGGITSQRFTLKGVFGPFSITGGMWFDPANVLYQRASLVTSFDFGGIAIGLTIYHAAIAWNTAWGWGADPCGGQTPSLKYIFSGTIAPITAKLTLIDCCTGTAFNNLTVSMTGLGLCCGITYDVEFSFSKTGFDYVSLSGINIPLCCGVSFDVGIEFGVGSKEIILTPKFAGIAEGCFTVWGDAEFDGLTWLGIRVDGFRIRCTFGDCPNYLEIVDVFNFDSTTSAVPKAVRDLFTRTETCREFEYIGIGFCGAACCGGKYSVDLRIFFAEDGYGDGIFGISKFTGTVKIPIMTNFTLNLDFVMPAVGGNPPPCVSPSFCLGWTFTF